MTKKQNNVIIINTNYISKYIVGRQIGYHTLFHIWICLLPIWVVIVINLFSDKKQTTEVIASTISASEVATEAATEAASEAATEAATEAASEAASDHYVEEILDYIYLKESSSGKNDNKCERLGPNSHNGYGYGQGHGKNFCLGSDEEMREVVRKWVEKRKEGLDKNTLLCYYNTGKKVNSCEYLTKITN